MRTLFIAGVLCSPGFPVHSMIKYRHHFVRTCETLIKTTYWAVIGSSMIPRKSRLGSSNLEGPEGSN